MYYPINWPKAIRLPGLSNSDICHVLCNRDKVLVAVLCSDSLIIYYSKPCIPVSVWKRDARSIAELGFNEQLEWRPDSSVIAVTTSKGYLSFYTLSLDPGKSSLYEQRDSSRPGFKRESAELYGKDAIPPLVLHLRQTIPIEGGATSMACIRDELMVATKLSHILRYRWDATLNRDYCLDLRRVPFCVDQLPATRAVPITEPKTFVSIVDYSPLLGGFAIVLNNGKGAFLTATTLKFDPNQVQGIWAPFDDATSTAINHRYRLIAFGRGNSHADVFSIDESTGGLLLSHTLRLSSRDFTGCPGPVNLVRWSPDGCCLALSWLQGAISLWSTFGALLLCTLNWDYGLSPSLPTTPNVDGSLGPVGATTQPLRVTTMDWGIEGYQLWMVSCCDSGDDTKVLTQLELAKSPLTANPCVGPKERLYLHADDRVYINVSDAPSQRNSGGAMTERGSGGGACEALLSSKQWLIVQVPNAYMSGNWPLRFACIDNACENLAVAGRTGLALYSFITRRWKLFGNESQEKDFVVTGGLLWWKQQLVIGCYSIVADRDQVRIYPRDSPRLDNSHCTTMPVSSQVLLLSVMTDTLLVYTADCRLNLFQLRDAEFSALQPTSATPALLNQTQEIDISTLGLHPACLVAAGLTTLSTEPQRPGSLQSGPLYQRQNILLNVCGRVLFIQRERGANGEEGQYAVPTVLASCVEVVWVPNPSCSASSQSKPHLTQALWLCCGTLGMRVWLPLYPRDQDKGHTYMSKRIMLPFQLHIYPLSVLFEEAILLGVETDTIRYPTQALASGTPTGRGSDSLGHWLRRMPYCVLERNSQVYLHQIFRQLIRRNLGFHAWEIARGCTSLPYFAHSLELLLHEVLEEEATCKEPIPDALLPSVLEFIREFPVYLTTIVQCARKTEVALWPYLFSVAPNPRMLFQRCLDMKLLHIAASYLIILQNMEPVTISRQHATVLLDAALDACAWDLAKDLVRFLRAIDPSDVDPCSSLAGVTSGSSAASVVGSAAGAVVVASGGSGTTGAVGGAGAALLRVASHGPPQTPPVSPNEEDLNFLLGGSIHRNRLSGAMKSPALTNSDVSQSALGQPAIHHSTSITAGSCSSGSAKLSDASSTHTSTGSKSNLARKISAATNPAGDEHGDELLLDAILEKHGRRLLSGGRLRDLGYLTAHFDWPIVTWLSKEKNSAAKVDDFVAALRGIHRDFSWPMPAPGPNLRLAYNSSRRLSDAHRSGAQFADSLRTDERHASVQLEDRFQMLEVDVTHPLLGAKALPAQHNGDSGYLSTVGDNGEPSKASAGLLLQTVEAHLKPYLDEARASSEAEDNSSLWGEERNFDVESIHESNWSLNSGSGESEVVHELKANPKTEMQLRYLLQLFIEAECLDWALILSMALRDAMAVLRLVSLARGLLLSSSSSPLSVYAVTRIRDGLLSLSHWVETESGGYRSFMSVIYAQIGILTKLILPKKPSDCVTIYSVHDVAQVAPLVGPPLSPVTVTVPQPVEREAERRQKPVRNGGADFPVARDCEIAPVHRVHQHSSESRRIADDTEVANCVLS